MELQDLYLAVLRSRLPVNIILEEVDDVGYMRQYYIYDRIHYVGVLGIPPSRGTFKFKKFGMAKTSAGKYNSRKLSSIRLQKVLLCLA